MFIFYIGLFSIFLYVGGYLSYTLFLLLANYFIREKPAHITSPEKTFVIIIPAHNEEMFLGRLLSSLKAQDYPAEFFYIVVVADNCTDNTARIAAEFKVNTLQRFDKERVGKGFAIKYAIDNMPITKYDAIFIVDSDSILEKSGLKKLDIALREGNSIIQCYNGVLNPDSSWFSRLMSVSRTISNEIMEPAKEKLHLSSHLMGNGMCFHKDIVRQYGWDSFSVGEDWEYYVKIINQGVRVAYAKNVRVYHQESSSLKQATSQRIRWSSGRFAIIWKYGLKLFFSGIAKKDLFKVDASLPLILPNPSMAMNLTVIGFILSLFIYDNFIGKFFFFFFSVFMLLSFLIFLSGVMLTEDKLASLLSLFFAPVFLTWKMAIDLFSLFGIGRKKWIRTKRNI